MIETHGVVIRIEDGVAYVEARREPSGCGGCDSVKGCATGTLSKFFGRGRGVMRAQNTVGAGVGDSVVVGINEGGLLHGSVAVYLMPLLLLLGGAIGASAFAPAAALKEAYSIWGAALGLGAGFLWVKAFSFWAGSRRRFQPVILRCSSFK